jgi:hypothetical protein
MAPAVALPWLMREVGVLPFIGGRRLQRRFASQPRRHGRCMVACMGKVRQRRGWWGGDVVGAADLWVLGAWHKGRGSGRRFGMGGPTAHGPADGSRPQRLCPEGPTACVTRDAGVKARS